MRYNLSMIYLITALYAEAKPLLEHWSFKRDKALPCRFYRNDDICLLVTQVGMDNASKALQSLMRYLPTQDGDILINIGLCAAPATYPLGTALLTHTLNYEDQSIPLALPLDNTLPGSTLQTVRTPATNSGDDAVDMEAFAIYQECKSFFASDKIAFLKIVSDHFEPESVDKEQAIDAIKNNIPNLETLITAMPRRER